MRSFALTCLVFIAGCAHGPTHSQIAEAVPTRHFPAPWEKQLANGHGTAPQLAASPEAPKGLGGASPAPSLPNMTAIAAAPQPSAYALIIGIEKYRDLPAPTGARYDAEQFAEVAKKTLGIPSSHIQVAIDDRGSKTDIEKHLEWLRATVPAGGRVYFYFSGHGSPDTASGDPYLIPYDGDPRYMKRTAISLSSVMKSLQETKAREVLAVLDSCFSGSGGRSVLPPGARPLVRVKEAAPTARIALLTASSAEQISGPVPGGHGGLFTHYFLESIGGGKADRDGDGQVSLQEIADFVTPRVAREAKKDNRDQVPGVTLGNSIANSSDFIVAWGLPTK